MPHLEIKVKDVFKVMFFISTLLTTNLAQNEKKFLLEPYLLVLNFRDLK